MLLMICILVAVMLLLGDAAVLPERSPLAVNTARMVLVHTV